MTDPLTPPSCDLTDFQFMPLDVMRLRDSELASNETPEACWAAVLLWAASWHQVPAASVPNDDKWLAKAAGYGRVVREWLRVKDGAMRGFIECSDGRLYHSVVAEKAREAWQAKLEQRWRTEIARIKKHNDRHKTDIHRPPFDEWMSLGCPQGHMLFVPRDTLDCPSTVPRETTSKGQGEGQGQGQGDSYSEAKASGAAGAPPVDNSENPKPEPAKRAAWRDCGKWMVANGMAEATAREVMGLVVKDYPDVAIDALTSAPKKADTPDPKAYLIATAQRLSGERRVSPTVPSIAADQTQQYLEELRTHHDGAEAERGIPEVRAALRERLASARAAITNPPHRAAQ